MASSRSGDTPAPPAPPDDRQDVDGAAPGALSGLAGAPARGSGDLAAALRGILEATPEGVAYIEVSGQVSFYNQRLLELWQIPEEVVRLGSLADMNAVLSERMAEPQVMIELIERVRATGQEGRVSLELKSGGALECTVRQVVVDGKAAGRIWLFRDITEQRRAARALAESEANLRSIVEEQQRLISTIQEIGTPVLPIYNQVLVLPLVGHLDGTRSTHLMDALLQAIQRYQAMVVIIDITGVSIVDTSVANSLIESTRAAELLGAQCVLVGISSAVARTIVHLGLDLTSVVTKRDLQAGVAYALKQVGCAISRFRTEPDWITELLDEEEATRKASS